jgi:hypothetical protein
LFYAVGTGNVFLESTIERAEQLGKMYRDIPYSSAASRALGIDPGFGSSKTAFTVIEIVDNSIIHVLYSRQFANSSTQQMVQHAKDLMLQYGILENDSNKVFIDGSQPGFIRSLKYQTNENPQYEQIIGKAKENNQEDQLYLYMNIVPVNFSTRHKQMLGNLKKYMDMERVAIHPQENKELFTELRIATANEDMLL